MKSCRGFLVMLLMFASCSQSEKKVEQPGLLVINVLEKEFYDDAHIQGSINVPFDQVSSYVDKFDRHTHIIAYCSNYMCSASGMVVSDLQKMGFHHLWAYEGGMAEWYQRGYPIQGPATKAYLRAKTEKPASETQNSAQAPVTQISVISAEDLKAKMEAYKLL